MCGFVVSKSSSFDFKTALNLAKYRGPDYQGTVSYQNLKMGHNRLSIIDLNERSNQPFEIDNYSMVFNGEIYNYKEIKKELEIKFDINFRTTSDTEVLLRSFIIWGKDFFKKINGMFSFVIYDKNNDSLICAVDRLGVKPCYFKINENEIVIASECWGMSNKLSSKSVRSFLTYGYNSPPYTIYDDVYRLKPGTFLEIDLNTHEKNIKNYWDYYNHELMDYDPEYFKKILKDSIKLRLESDVEIAALLSGGVDSTLLASILKELNIKIKYFTIGVPNSELDESVRAKKIAKHLKLDHSVHYLNENDVKEMLEKYCCSMDEPLGDSSILPTMFVFKKISENFKVVLSADGGDEMAMGYPKYYGIKKNIIRRKIIQKIPFKYLRVLMHKILKILFNGRMRHDLYLEAIFNKGIDTEEKMLKHLSRKISVEKSKEIFYESSEENNYVLNSSNIQNKNSIQTISDIGNYLSGDILRKVDKASMVFSVESREPFLDYRLFDYMLSVSEEKKFNNNKMKIPLRDILEDFVPKEIWEHKKTGFSVPIEKWMRTWLLDDIHSSINMLSKLKFIKQDFTLKLLKKFLKGDNSDSDLFWNIFILGKFIKNKK